MLTDTKIKKLKPSPDIEKRPDKYSDGGGLQLHVFSNGSKYWRLAYRFEGKPMMQAWADYLDALKATQNKEG
ncbi:hypothetical protein BKE30_11330 [Alkanindiges hydrocarboniclasticus]|uniref:Integrase DNA-binding domain-containing protein n=1 Tax=Alkanindiges hydrocarboniclasticus TaxID=1907941 RepID=A0A1S8CS88_9GAMM|nr:Arm DNA-binding domain-containing protein [Alkanindiges hydrocarboniclasticus]ONG38752.1 hypothetical protein BKE30_11330 [Alkanindiges hydrocarboniclasticus]